MDANKQFEIGQTLYFKIDILEDNAMMSPLAMKMILNMCLLCLTMG